MFPSIHILAPHSPKKGQGRSLLIDNDIIFIHRCKSTRVSYNNSRLHSALSDVTYGHASNGKRSSHRGQFLMPGFLDADLEADHTQVECCCGCCCSRFPWNMIRSQDIFLNSVDHLDDG